MYFPHWKPLLRSDAILATNTSYLNMNQIASSLKNPSRVVGMHLKDMLQLLTNSAKWADSAEKQVLAGTTILPK